MIGSVFEASRVRGTDILEGRREEGEEDVMSLVLRKSWSNKWESLEYRRLALGVPHWTGVGAVLPPTACSVMVGNAGERRLPTATLPWMPKAGVWAAIGDRWHWHKPPRQKQRAVM